LVTIIGKNPLFRFIEWLMYLVSIIKQIHQLFNETNNWVFAYNIQWNCSQLFNEFMKRRYSKQLHQQRLATKVKTGISSTLKFYKNKKFAPVITGKYIIYAPIRHIDKIMPLQKKWVNCSSSFNICNTCCGLT